MRLQDIFENVVDAITGNDHEENENPAPASQDPWGDPANQMSNSNVTPASQDPYGDPADQGGQNVAPASQDPYGDPADRR